MSDATEIQSEFDRHEGDSDWIDEGNELYEEMLDTLIENYGSDVIDNHAAELMYSGWFDPDSTSFDRAIDRWEFFDYTGLEWDDFDWDDWRDWYES